MTDIYSLSEEITYKHYGQVLKMTSGNVTVRATNTNGSLRELLLLAVVELFPEINPLTAYHLSRLLYRHHKRNADLSISAGAG